MSGDQRKTDFKARRALRIAYWRWGSLVYVLSLMAFFYSLWWYPTILTPNLMVGMTMVNFLIVWPVLACLSRFCVATGTTAGAYVVFLGSYGLPPIDQIFFYVVLGGVLGFVVDATIGYPGYVTRDDRLSDETIESETLSEAL